LWSMTSRAPGSATMPPGSLVGTDPANTNPSSAAASALENPSGVPGVPAKKSEVFPLPGLTAMIVVPLP
jgi:hypothetical protein